MVRVEWMAAGVLHEDRFPSASACARWVLYLLGRGGVEYVLVSGV